MGDAADIIKRRIAMLEKLLAREINHRCRILHEEAIRHLSEVLVEIEETTSAPLIAADDHSCCCRLCGCAPSDPHGKCDTTRLCGDCHEFGSQGEAGRNG